MSKETLQPVIPDSELQEQWQSDERLQEVHERMAHMDLRKFWDNMPLPQTHSSDTASYVDLRPKEGHDGQSAIMLPLPFANGWTPHMAMRAKLLQDSLSEPTRVLVFPNNTFTYSAYDLSDSQREDVAGGSLSPVVEKMFRSLDIAKVERVSVIGYSQGASIGATALKLMAAGGDFEIGPSGLFEPPNVVGRTKKELANDFKGEGLKSLRALNKAINDSALPTLTEATKSGPGQLVRQLAGLALVQAGAWKAENKALHEGLTYPSFTHELDSAIGNSDDVDVLLAAAESSRVSVPLLLQFYGRDDPEQQVRFKLIEGYGHEAGDNLVVHTLLSKDALRQAA